MDKKAEGVIAKIYGLQDAHLSMTLACRLRLTANAIADYRRRKYD